MENAVDMYRAFLLGIDKGKTAVVKIDKWNRFINLVLADWLDERIAKSLMANIVFPELESLHVDTDGVSHNPVAPVGTFGGDKYLFGIPYNGNSINSIDIDTGQVQKYIYPHFYHLITVQFKIRIKYNPNDLGEISDWLPSRLMKIRQRGFILQNDYEQPLDTRLYYEALGEVIRLATGRVSGKSLSEGYAMRIEYYKEPWRIELDPNGAILHDMVSTRKARKEVVDMAVRIYLEQKQNPRYQSYLNEMVIRERTKL